VSDWGGKAPWDVSQWRGWGSGAGTNLKVGAPIRRKAPEKFFCRALPLFCSKSAINRFGERFRDGQYSLVSFLFAVLLSYLWCPRAHPFVKVGSTCPPNPMESAPLDGVKIASYSMRYRNNDELSVWSCVSRVSEGWARGSVDPPLNLELRSEIAYGAYENQRIMLHMIKLDSLALTFPAVEKLFPRA